MWDTLPPRVASFGALGPGVPISPSDNGSEEQSETAKHAFERAVGDGRGG